MCKKVEEAFTEDIIEVGVEASDLALVVAVADGSKHECCVRLHGVVVAVVWLV